MWEEEGFEKKRLNFDFDKTSSSSQLTLAGHHDQIMLFPLEKVIRVTRLRIPCLSGCFHGKGTKNVFGFNQKAFLSPSILVALPGRL